MKKKISPNDCNEMFEDRLKNLTMKEQCLLYKSRINGST